MSAGAPTPFYCVLTTMTSPDTETVALALICIGVFHNALLSMICIDISLRIDYQSTEYINCE